MPIANAASANEPGAALLIAGTYEKAICGWELGKESSVTPVFQVPDSSRPPSLSLSLSLLSVQPVCRDKICTIDTKEPCIHSYLCTLFRQTFIPAFKHA
jgi:hypothetical protein